MRMVIHKQALVMQERQIIMMPAFFKIIALQEQNRVPTIWYEHNLDSTLGEHQAKIFIVGTGHIVPAEARSHLGTLQFGPMVWHFYMDRRNEHS
jgi:hypothetical protein